MVDLGQTVQPNLFLFLEYRYDFFFFVNLYTNLKLALILFFNADIWLQHCIVLFQYAMCDSTDIASELSIRSVEILKREHI